MQTRSLLPAFAAAALWGLAGIFSMTAFRQDAGLTSLSATLSRVVVNLVFVIFIFRIARGGRGLPWSNGSATLWLWGALGSATITSFFFAVRLVGIGEATLLQGAQGIVVAMLSPKVLRQNISGITILGILFGLCGLALLIGESAGNREITGRVWGLVSGASAGFAYILLARNKERHSEETYGFYWCLVSLLVVFGLSSFQSLEWPANPSTFLLLLISGILAASAQWLTSRAYKQVPAALVSATSYLAPMLGFSFECLIYGSQFGPSKILAIFLIVCAGIGFPLWQLNRNHRVFLISRP